MSAMILVATPHTAFGELLRISLEDSAQYQVRLVQSTKEARAAAGRSVIQLAILDTALSGEPFVPFCYDLLELQPGIRLIVVPPDNNPSHPSLGGLMPHGYLNRPFYLPDLMDLISRLIQTQEKQPAETAAGQILRDALPTSAPSVSLPPWLQEPLTLHAYLENQLPTTQALAALVGLNSPQPGTGTLRASSGCFSDSASEELANVVFRYWNRSEKTDLMRFVRLSSDKRDYLIYATHLTGDLVLILAYDNASPLSLIRPQTKTMAQTLATQPPRDYLSGTATVFSPGDAGALSAPQVGQNPAEPREAAPVIPQEPAILDDNPPGSEPQPEPSGAELAEQPADETFGWPEENDSASGESLDDDYFLSRLRAGFAPVDQPADAMPSAPQDQDSVSFTNTFPAVDPEEDNLDDTDLIDHEIFNLSVMLGSIPSPDPKGTDRDLSLVDSAYNSDWIFENSSGAPIPTLPGKHNGADHFHAEPDNSWVTEDQPVETEPSADVPSSTPTQPSADPSTMQTAPLNPEVLNTERPGAPFVPTDFPTAPSGRSAAIDVNTEPPVKTGRFGAPLDLRPTAPPPARLDSEDEEYGLDLPGDTQPNVVSSITHLDQMEPVSPALSLLNYTCVLVPRLPQHYLTGELADRLAGWVHQLCLAFGWRLEGISIRPEYLQWTVQVAPAISPGNLVRIIRQRTSQHIFNHFGHLAAQNPSGDFWAIGYLIVSGAQPPSAQLLRDYIAQTRKRQGINK